MIRIRHHALCVSATKAAEALEWTLNNFDFERGYITVNAHEDVGMDRLMCAQQLRAANGIAARGGGDFTIWRTLYFHEEQAEQAMLYRLKFV